MTLHPFGCGRIPPVSASSSLCVFPLPVSISAPSASLQRIRVLAVGGLLENPGQTWVCDGLSLLHNGEDLFSKQGNSPRSQGLRCEHICGTTVLSDCYLGDDNGDTKQ